MQGNYDKTVARDGVYCVEDLLKKSGGGQFSLVRIAMLRARELDSGKPSLIENFNSKKTKLATL